MRKYELKILQWIIIRLGIIFGHFCQLICSKINRKYIKFRGT